MWPSQNILTLTFDILAKITYDDSLTFPHFEFKQFCRLIGIKNLHCFGEKNFIFFSKISKGFIMKTSQKRIHYKTGQKINQNLHCAVYAKRRQPFYDWRA